MSEFALQNASRPQRLATLAKFLGGSALSSKAKAYSRGLAGFKTIPINKAEYNINSGARVSRGYPSKNEKNLKKMIEATSGASKTLADSEGERSMLTVAETLGRRGASEAAREIMVMNMTDPRTSPYFRILPPVEDYEAAISGIKQEVMKFGYTPMQEAPEFAPPHFFGFRTELYTSKGYRFNTGYNFNAEVLLTRGGPAMMEKYAEVAMNNVITFMEQFIVHSLISKDDAYKDRKSTLLAELNSVRTIDGVMQDYQYKGETTGASFLVYGGMVGILHKRNGLEFLANWVKTIAAEQNVNLNYMFFVPGSLLSLAFDQGTYLEKGQVAIDAPKQGEKYVQSFFRTVLGNIELIPQAPYIMENSRVQTEQPLSNFMTMGQFYLLTNDVYGKQAAMQASRGVDSSAPRFGSNLNDLYTLNYSTEQITINHQKFEDVMRAALCWDEHGNLNHLVYENLVNPDIVRQLANRVGIEVPDIKNFKPDPWIVESDGQYKVVTMVGNQDRCHTSVKDTKLTIDMAYNRIRHDIEKTGTKEVEALVTLMRNNYNVKPDNNGEIEAFWTAVAWENVEQRKLDHDEAIHYIPHAHLPELTPAANQRGTIMSKKGYTRRDPVTNRSVTLFKVPIIDTDEGPLFYTPRRLRSTGIIGENHLWNLAGYLPLEGGVVDIYSLLFLNVDGDVRAGVRALIDAYIRNYDTDARVAVGVNVRGLIEADVLVQLTQIGGNPIQNHMAGYSFVTFNENTPVYVANEDVSGYPFTSQPNADVRDRLTQAVLLVDRNRKLVETARRYGGEASLRNLVKMSEQHPSYEWIDTRLVYDPVTGTGFVNNDDRIAADPTQSTSTGMSLFDDRALNHPTFFGVKMAYLDYRVASYFHTFEELQQCTMAGQKGTSNVLPGFSTFYSMKSISDHMSSVEDHYGWNSVGAKSMIDTIVAGVHVLDKFIDLCMKIFCPISSSQTRGDLNVGPSFLANMFLHHMQTTEDDIENAKLTFGNMIFETSARNFGLIQPFTSYPVHVTAQSMDSHSYNIRGSELVVKRAPIELSLRYTDNPELKSKTPFVVHSAIASGTSFEVSAGYGIDVTIQKQSVYSYFNSKDLSDQKSSPSSSQFQNFMNSGPIKSDIDRHSDLEAKFVVKKEYVEILSALSDSSDFNFARELVNSSKNNKIGTSSSGGSVVFAPAGSSSPEFFQTFASIVERVRDSYGDSFYTDISSFKQAVKLSVLILKDFFNETFDDPQDINDPSTFLQKFQTDKSLQKRYETMRSVVAEEVGAYVDMAESSGQSGLNATDRAELSAYYQSLHQDLKNVLYNTEPGIMRFYVTNMFLSVNAKYWVDVDDKFKRLYGLSSSGMGIDLSMARPQSKYGRHFLDVTVQTTPSGLRMNSPGRKLAKYHELINFGPGSKNNFNLNSFLSKMTNKDYSSSSTHLHDDDHHSSSRMMLDEKFHPNVHFYDRLKEFEGDWMKKAIALAYLTAAPTADLMINLHSYGIPQPMTLIAFDPMMTFRMNSLLFVEGGSGLGNLFHNLTLHTSNMSSDTRIMTDHISLWLNAHLPYPEKILQIPNASFSAVGSGCSGSLIKSIRNYREYNKHGEDVQFDWDPSHPEHHKDRFVLYGGGSFSANDIGQEINVTGNNRCAGSQINCGVELPLGLIPITPQNTMEYPSALVFDIVSGYAGLNSNSRDQFLSPKSLMDIKENVPGGDGCSWNVWAYRGKQYRTDLTNGISLILDDPGNGPLASFDRGHGHILRGIPGSVFSSASTTPLTIC